MDVGKKLDESIAYHVFEWGNEGGQWVDPVTREPVSLPAFSADLTAAWKVAERICKEGFRLQLDGSKIWQARFYKSAAHSLETRAVAVTSKTPAQAICLAALAVKGAYTPRD